ncbi:DNA-directed RNA polymerase subunit alpha [Streptomyces tendae]
MARVSGVDIPREKRVEIALTYVFGIGRTLSQQTLAATGVDPNTRVRDLTEEQLVAIREYVDNNIKTEGDLRREIQADIPPQGRDRHLPGSASPSRSPRPRSAHQHQRAYPQGPASRHRRQEVLKVTYKVEATRVEQRTDFDKLIVDVETKQAMRPRDAMASAGKTLVELFGLARELNIDAEGIDMGPSPTDAALAADLALPIEELELTVRSYNCLKREGIHSVGELVARSEADLLDIRNFGAKSIDEVKAKLAGMGLALKDSPPGFYRLLRPTPLAPMTTRTRASWRPSSTDSAAGRLWLVAQFPAPLRGAAPPGRRKAPRISDRRPPARILTPVPDTAGADT